MKYTPITEDQINLMSRVAFAKCPEDLFGPEIPSIESFDETVANLEWTLHNQPHHLPRLKILAEWAKEIIPAGRYGQRIPYRMRVGFDVCCHNHKMTFRFITSNFALYFGAFDFNYFCGGALHRDVIEITKINDDVTSNGRVMERPRDTGNVLQIQNTDLTLPDTEYSYLDPDNFNVGDYFKVITCAFGTDAGFFESVSRGLST